MDETEIASELTQQGVTNVKRILIKKEDQVIKTGTCILTFSKPQQPERIQLGYVSVPVSIFIPSPLRYFNCQKFGHGPTGCKNKPICYKCAEEKHESACTRSLKCSSCSADHPASSKYCPVWIKEKEIQRVKCTERVSYTEVRTMVDKSSPFNSRKSYAFVIKPAMGADEYQISLGWIMKNHNKSTKALLHLKIRLKAPNANWWQSTFKLLKIRGHQLKIIRAQEGRRHMVQKHNYQI